MTRVTGRATARFAGAFVFVAAARAAGFAAALAGAVFVVDAAFAGAAFFAAGAVFFGSFSFSARVLGSMIAGSERAKNRAGRDPRPESDPAVSSFARISPACREQKPRRP